MSDEYNKGYFSTGPQRSYQAQQGQADRRERDRQAQESMDRAAREQQARDQEQRVRTAGRDQTPTAQTTLDGHRTGSHGSGLATLQGCAKGFALAGAVLFVLYAAFARNVAGWVPLAWWALQGAFAGALAGLVAYAAIVVLRIAVVVLAVVIKIAFFAALAIGGLYLLRGLA